MKTIVLIVALLTSIAVHNNSSAHSTHCVDESTAIQIVLAAIPQLTTRDFGFQVGQLDASWNPMDESNIAMVETDGDFFIMSARNAQSTTTIYFLIGINGQVLEVKDSNDF